ncbi:MAG TPA: IS4 family transposase [Chloroflexia bacterium]|nr:IS4 family transposase [Chloroflexia bacterium]
MARLQDLVQPATFAQVAAFQAAGLRQRILTLPVMVAFVLSLIWRQLGSVREAVRCLNQEGLLWTSPTPVSFQAAEERLRTLPPHLFKGVLDEILPQLHARAAARARRVAPVLVWAARHFSGVVSVDGSTRDGLLRQAGLLRAGAGPVLAGRMAGVLDVATCLPQHLWYEPDSSAHDQRFWPRIRAALTPGLLVLIDLGFWNYAHFDELATAEIWFLSRVKQNCAYRLVRVLHRSATVRESLIYLGREARPTDTRMRLVEILVGPRWVRYVTNVLEPAALPAAYMPLLYAERWRIEDAFKLVKRLLGLAYFWSGAGNAIQTQVWASWLLYGVLIDLTDEVAAHSRRPLGAVSVEMVFRALYHYTQAVQKQPGWDLVSYLVDKAAELDLFKARWQPPSPLPEEEDALPILRC